MMKQYPALLSTVVFAACAVVGRAADESGAEAAWNDAPSALQPVQSAVAEVETRDVRDPFWPVGFYPEWWNRPEAEDAAIVADAWEEAGKLLRVSGISRMGASGYIAHVNGRMVSPGDVVSVEHKGVTYRWEVVELGEIGIKFGRINP